MPDEVDAIRGRYERWKAVACRRQGPLSPVVVMERREFDRALVRWVASAGLAPVADRRLLEIGCGSGTNLLRLILLGFRPENLVGNELLDERAQEARHLLPAATQIIPGDATQLDLPDESFDVVMQSAVFTSILDDGFQRRLADRMWALVKPGGGVLWYDFVYDNPRNPDVRGVPVRRIRELFPQGRVRFRRITLAPPIARRVTPIHPSLYNAFNLFPFLRTHVLCWIAKT